MKGHIECGVFFFFFQAEDGIRDDLVTGVQTCALPILLTEIPRRLDCACVVKYSPSTNCTK